jgi:hypothetical protein
MSRTDIPRLPQSPDLEQERTRAKELLKALRIGEATAILRLRANHPRFAQLAPDAAAAGVKLSDAQWVIAREYGFPSWPALRAHIVAQTSGRAPVNEESETAVGGIFACKYERQLKSIGRAFPTSITFRNWTPRNISTFWLDENGERAVSRTVRSGYSYIQPTYISHPWVIVDAAGRCLGLVLPGSSTRTVTISNGSITASDIRADAEQKKGETEQKPRETLYCSFCGKSQHEVRKLVAGPNVYICDECVDLCEPLMKSPNLSSDDTIAKYWASRDAMPTELLLVRLRFQNALLERNRADLEDTLNALRRREVNWAAMGEALGISPQALQELFSRLSVSSS